MGFKYQSCPHFQDNGRPQFQQSHCCIVCIPTIIESKLSKLKGVSIFMKYLKKGENPNFDGG